MLRRKPLPDPTIAPVVLNGRRVVLRPIAVHDFAAWRDVRRRCNDWLTRWEPRRIPGQPDTVEDSAAFSSRCSVRMREIQLGTGYGFGIFVDGVFAGEININSIHRGAHQNAYVGYWIDEALAGQGYMPESVVAVLQFCFEQLLLHRVQISIIPRNTASRRVVEKLGIRPEGVAERYLEINGVWEDHIRYAITSEEWDLRRDELLTFWLL
ncbi:MAG TPA: GNAT family protein [Microthrixaceae bacterium]|nr:GNAT family protein [Microthrixaceae bacterium]